MNKNMFWSSVDLTGNQTCHTSGISPILFWSSVDLTGNQTVFWWTHTVLGFGAVSI